MDRSTNLIPEKVYKCFMAIFSPKWLHQFIVPWTFNVSILLFPLDSTSLSQISSNWREIKWIFVSIFIFCLLRVWNFLMINLLLTACSTNFPEANSSWSFWAFSVCFARSTLASVQFSSVAQLCPTLCNPTNHSTPDLPVHHQLPAFTQTHVHRIGDAVQPSHLCHPLLLLPPVHLIMLSSTGCTFLSSTVLASTSRVKS